MTTTTTTRIIIIIIIIIMMMMMMMMMTTINIAVPPYQNFLKQLSSLESSHAENYRSPQDQLS